MIGNPLLLGGGDYEISRSVRLRSSASAYFNRTPASAGSLTTWTWSGWVKLGAISSPYSLFGFQNFSAGVTDIRHYISFDSGGLVVYYADVNASITYAYVQSSAIYRDPSAWYHVVAVWDTTNATANDRVRLYVNGSRITAFANNTQPSQNRTGLLNSAVNTGLACLNRSIGPAFLLDGYMAEINFIDSQALTPSSFGESNATTGVWQPKKYTGTYGTNGFYLNFSDNSNNTAATIGKDYSGNGNNWTPNNISVTSGATYDSMLDVPTPWADGGNGRGNYCTANPLFTSNNITFSNANLSLDVGATGGVYRNAGGTFAQSTGKWYWEFAFGNTAANPLGGVGDVTQSRATWESDTTGNANFWYVNAINGNKVNAGSTSYGSSFLTTDICMVALDMDNGRIWWGKNGTWFASGDPAAGTNAAFTNLTGKTLAPAFFGGSGSSGGNSYTLNFGQRPFAYTPPSGFKALNTLNLPEPTIKKGNLYFDVLTWSGSGGSSRALTGLAFQPDFVWGKVRNTTYGHMLFDAVRGAGSLKELGTNVTGAEGYASSNQYGYLSAFNSDGFTVTAGTDGTIPNAYWNQSGNTYVAWQWKEGATQGFDIVTYTGTGVARTVAHSLGVAPSMMIVKNRSSGTDGWLIYHASIGNANFLEFTTAASAAAASAWNNTSPTSSVFTVGTSSRGNGNGNSLVAYLFSEVAGFSRFGSYTGNGSSDGPFVFCGFRPAFLMIKRTDSTGSWFMNDDARPGYNVNTFDLQANSSGAESSNSICDFTANGFKIRIDGLQVNASGGTFVFMAFAENPFKNALAR